MALGAHAHALGADALIVADAGLACALLAAIAAGADAIYAGLDEFLPPGTTYLEVNIWVLANDRGAVALRRMPFP